MKVLYIGDNDLISRRFNGFDYHNRLLDYEIESNMFVENKLSNEDFVYSNDNKNFNFTQAIINNKLFNDADLIHLHLIHNTTFDIKYLPLITRLKPTVITLHDPYFLNGHCIHHFDCEKWKLFCSNCDYLDIPFSINEDNSALQFAYKKIIINNSYLSAIVASKWMLEKVNLSPIWNRKNIYLLPFGVDQNIFKPLDDKVHLKKKLNINENSFIIMFRSQKSLFKGVELIEYAINNICSIKKIIVITIGELNVIKKSDKYKLMEFGWITDVNKLVELYQICDIYLMPSKQESFGLMAIEAMNCGKFVLSTKNTALETIIGSPKYGIAVDYDEKAFTNELQRLLDNENELDYRSNNIYNFAKYNYNINNFYDNLKIIYKDILNNFNINLENYNINNFKKYFEDKIDINKIYNLYMIFDEAKINFNNFLDIKKYIEDIISQNKKMKEIKCNLEKKINELNIDVSKLNYYIYLINIIKNNWLCKKLYIIIKCVKKNGILYTIILIMKKIMNIFTRK